MSLQEPISVGTQNDHNYGDFTNKKIPVQESEKIFPWFFRESLFSLPPTSTYKFIHLLKALIIFHHDYKLEGSPE